MKRWLGPILTGAAMIGVVVGCHSHGTAEVGRAGTDCGCSGIGIVPAANAAGTAAELLAAGNKAYAAGDPQLALALLSQAAGKARISGDSALAADAVLALASVMASENMSREAIDPLTQVSHLPGIDPQRKERLCLVLADCQLRAGSPRQAVVTLDALAGGSQGAKLLSGMMRSRALLESRKYEEAFAELAAIRDDALADRIVRPEFLLLTAVEQGDLNQRPEARATLELLAADPDPSAAHLIGALRLLAGLGDAPESTLALRLRDLVLNSPQAGADSRIRSMAWGYAAQVAEGQGRLDDALELTRRALQPSSGALDPGLDMLWNWQLARLLQRQDKFQEADIRYQAAYALAAAPRLEQSLPAELPAFCGHERPQDLFRDYADFLLLHAEQVRPAREDAWHEALKVMNSRRELQVRDFLQDQCLASLVGREKSVETIAPGSAILHIMVLSGRTEVLLQVQDHIYRHVVDVRAADFLAQVDAFRKAVVNINGAPYRPSGKQLYDWLVRPFDEQLAAIDTLVIATDGALQLVPFGALYDGTGFLIEKKAIATTPSLHLLDARATDTRTAVILAAGLTRDVQIGGTLFEALPEVDREIGALVALHAHSRVLEDSHFTPGEFQRALADNSYSIVHIASHANVGTDPEDFFIVSGDGKIDLDGLDQAIRPTLYRQQPLELLVLSACETAGGDDRIAMGLAGVALKAGARSTLASLWPVGDQPSADLMNGFYSAWFSPAAPSKAKALREAQLGLLHNSGTRQPKYWAPYILIGNWQ